VVVAIERANLRAWGWNESFERLFQDYHADDLLPGRVTLEFNQFFRLQTPAGELLAEVAGRLRHEASSRAELPAVGDWVVIRRLKNEERATIIAVLPRQSRFTRKVKGTKTDEQVIAANVDTVFLVTSLNQDYNPRRLERYLSIARESGARPVILLTKSDLCAETPARLAEIGAIAPDLPVHAISALHLRDQFLTTIAPYLVSGQTIALIGSSGIDPAQPAPRRGSSDGQPGPRRRRPWPSYHPPPRTGSPPQRLSRHRYPGHARDPTLGDR
jgi:ribosome biogenesis GTPase